MTIKVMTLLDKFDNIGDRESETAFYRTHIPWLAPLAYLNIIFKPAPEDALAIVAKKLKIPMPVLEFLRNQNGAILFSGALSVYGIHRPGQLINRDDPSCDLPFNIELENQNWPPLDTIRHLVIGGYGFDGSAVCIDRQDYRICLFQRGRRQLQSKPSFTWPSLEEWLRNEITRLAAIFDSGGKRLVDESQTLPFRVSSA